MYFYLTFSIQTIFKNISKFIQNAYFITTIFCITTPSYRFLPSYFLQRPSVFCTHLFLSHLYFFKFQFFPTISYFFSQFNWCNVHVTYTLLLLISITRHHDVMSHDHFAEFSLFQHGCQSCISQQTDTEAVIAVKTVWSSFTMYKN